ncbi:hypothetical protein ACFFGT_32495 [Mucilaginibacter angelicae]|uniref:Carboxypeptidase regulatory-like domain-containing protein n=1 Tax=Mucilaginibacter angelicae TaxID=869718 RepID=A0ABV6LHQ8_9SPHI
MKDLLSKTDGCTPKLCGRFFSAIKTMRLHFKSLVFLLPLMLMLQHNCFGQTEALKQQLLKIKAEADSSEMKNPAEKIYLQLDKNTYTPGDTLWFKAYLFNAPTLNLSAKSGLMYVSIVTDNNVVVKRQRIPVENGLSWGNISLKELPAATYTLIAYTQWLQNFGNDCFFRKQFTIVDDTRSNWLVNYKTTINIADGKEQAGVKLWLRDFNKTAIADKPVQLAVINGTRRLFKQTVQTDASGLIDIGFNLPDKTHGLSINAWDQNNNKINVPLNFNRPQDADVQFMPEGGSLVAGLNAHIGFKAIGQDGRGIAVKGVVVDQNQEQVAEFASYHLGMGSFDMAVKKGENYVARVTLPGGAIKEYPLPAVKTSGIVLRVSNAVNKDSVRLLISASEDIIASGESYFIVGKARGIVCYAATLNFKDGGRANKNISKQLFPSGITHFVLMDAKVHPVNERLIFINQHDHLHINIAANKAVYAPHDSVALRIKISDAIGNPVMANFSASITDDGQVNTDTLNNINIISNVLLTSELKGYVENPGYYLQNDQHQQALDDLLLTQGWVNYNWLTEKDNITYMAENEFAVKGRVLNFFNKPVKTTRVTLLSKSPLLFADATTDKNGRFVFNNLPVVDSPAFVLKTVKNFNVNIVMDDQAEPILSAATGPAPVPWYISTDTTLLNNLKNNRIRQNLLNDLPMEGHILNEVKVTAKKIIKGSQNLNGPGEADMVFDEADMEKAGKKNWLEFFKENIKGFAERSNAYFKWYYIQDKLIKILIDGIDASTIIHINNYNDLTDYLIARSAEDIKGVEVMLSSKYAGNYERRFGSGWIEYPSVFIEISTRSGHGVEINNIPGVYLYKPLALSLPAQFYQPKYRINDTRKHLPDLRSTIHWQPNVTTGADGKATVSFFTADKPSTYTFIMEGTDGNGSIGFKTGKIKVNSSITP